MPGSHKANFPRDNSYFYPESYTDDGYNDDYFSTDVPEGVLNITPKAGDVVVHLDGKDIKNIYDYTGALGSIKIGKPTKVTVMRKGKKVELQITPEARE